MRLIPIAIGGALGALLRYSLSGVIQNWAGPSFPWGTLTVNLIGCFLIGLLYQMFTAVTISPATRSFILVGGLGAFTTFSTYGLESLNLIQEGQLRLGILNILGSNLLGLLCVFLGFTAARWLLTPFR